MVIPNEVAKIIALLMYWTTALEQSVFHYFYVLLQLALCSKHFKTVVNCTCLDQFDI